jgi:hypothetical protein
MILSNCHQSGFPNCIAQTHPVKHTSCEYSNGCNSLLV